LTESTPNTLPPAINTLEMSTCFLPMRSTRSQAYRLPGRFAAAEMRALL